MAITKPSKPPVRKKPDTSAPSNSAVLKLSVQFSAAMLSLVALSRSKPSGRRKEPEGALTKILGFRQHAVKLGTPYGEIGEPKLEHLPPINFVAAILRGAK